MEYIQGEKFLALHNNIDVFYCNTEDVNNFFNNANIENEFILISHNSDGKVFQGGDVYPHADINLIPRNLKKWYAQNVCDYHEKVESIPIGLENNKWFPELNKFEKIKNKKSETKQISNLLYINHNIHTNPKERTLPYELFGNSNFVTCKMGSNGFGFDQYLDDIYNHKFVLCPEGNGTDTHRTWECLYLGTIPIEKRNINNSYYTDLPICFVDDWSEINEDFLYSEYDRIKSKKWDLAKLDFSYWQNKIKTF